MVALRHAALVLLVTGALLGGCGGNGGGGAPEQPNAAPVAAFSATPPTGSAPLTVLFDASASADTDGTIAGYRWNFGDDSPPGTGVTVSHVFQRAGTFTVGLSVTDDDGAGGAASRAVVVSNPVVPDVVGMTEPVARTNLTNAGFAVGSVSTASSASVAAGVVMSQLPAGGLVAPPGSTIDLVVSSGAVSTKPVAVLRGPAEARVGSRVTVFGDASTPSPSDTVTYRWKLIPPAGSSAVISQRVAYNADVTPDVAGRYRLELTVNDAGQESNTAVLSFDATHVEVNTVSPRAGALVPDSARVLAMVWSTYEISRVTASISGREAVLRYDATASCDGSGGSSTCPGFVGFVSLAGLPVGIHLLSVHAVDTRGNADEVSLSVIHDNPPTITVTAPLDHSVALPSIPLDARCSDDSPGCTVDVYANLSPLVETLLLSSPGFVSQSLDLTRWMGSSLRLELRARDSAGQQVAADRTVYVEDPSRLALVAEAPGEIVDVDGAKLLYRVATGTGNSLAIQDRRTSLGQDIPMPAARRRTGPAYLTPAGAIFVAYTDATASYPSGLYLWRGGLLADLGRLDGNESLTVRGRFAIWSDGSLLSRLDTTSGVQQLVTSNAGNMYNSITADGTVAYWSNDLQIFLDRTGTPEALTTDTSQWHIYPVTDGQDVVYTRSDPCCVAQQFTIVLLSAGGSTALTGKREIGTYPGGSYWIEDGWVAFTELGSAQQLHVYTRSPLGTTLRLTDFATSSRLERLAGNGEVMLLNGTRRYFSRGAGLIPVSGASALSTYGKSYWLDGKWYLAIGRALFEVNTTP